MTAPASDMAIATLNTITRPWWNGPEIRCGKYSLLGQHRGVGPGQPRQHAGRPEQAPDRVVAEERREQRAHRRQAGDVRGERPRARRARAARR